jgi:hypothetical protein
MRDQQPARIVILFVIAVLLFTHPFLSIFDQPTLTLSLPTLYVYFFVLWGAMIAVMWVLLRKKK